MTYNDRHKHERDDLLHFDEAEHKYTCNGKQLESVTTVVENCFKKFDADYWAERKASQLGITPEELKAEWEAKAQQARDLGTMMHDKIEKYYLGIESESDETFDMFLQFAAEHELCPYRTEWRIYYEEYGNYDKVLDDKYFEDLIEAILKQAIYDGKKEPSRNEYDMDYTDLSNIQPMFFRAKMEKGVIDVTDCEVFK